MAKTWRKWLLTLTTALFVVLSALGWSLCLGDNFAKADTTLNTTSVTVTGATYGDGWLSITMSGVTYTNTGNPADFNGITNVGDHVWFSTDGEIWTAKCNAGVGSENFVRTYWTGGTLNINVSKDFATDGYTYIKIQEGTIFPADGAFSEENSYYKTTEEVILKTDATSISNGTTYAKYVAPTEVTVTGAKYGDGWLGIRFAGVSYTNDLKTITASNTNVGNHILFSADGNTWVEKSTLFAAEYFARNYSLANCVNVGGLSATFSVTSYPYIKILEGTKFPADSAFDGTTSCNVTTEETILHYDNATGEYVKYVAPTAPVGVDTTVTGLVETNYGYWGFNIGTHDYPTTGSNVSITSYRNLFESNFTSKIKLTYTNGTTQYLSALTIQQFHLNLSGGNIMFDTASDVWPLSDVASVTIEAGCQFPNYAYISGSSTANTYYETTEDVTFVNKKTAAAVAGTMTWAKMEYTSISIRKAFILKESGDANGFVVLQLSTSDYGTTPNAALGSEIKTDAAFAFMDQIYVNGNKLSTYSVGEVLVDFYGNQNTIAFRLNLNANDWFGAIQTITVGADCTLPTLAYVNSTSTSVINAYKVDKAYSFKTAGTSNAGVPNNFVIVAAFTSVSINVGNSLALNFYATVADIDEHTVKIVATMGDDTQTHELSSDSIEQDGNNLKFTYNDIAPQNIRDTLTLTLYLDNNAVDTMTYSVWSYCNAVLADATSSAKLKALAKEVLVYGGAMQDYLNGTGDEIAEDADGNAIVSDVTYDGTTIENVSQKITETGADTTTYRFRAVGLRVDNCNALYFRYYVKNGASAKIYINDVDYTANATVYATETEGKIYIVYVRNITPLNYADVYTAQLYGCADTTAEGATYELVETVKYSVNSFIRSKAEGEDAQLSALAKALYGYNVKANAYFKDSSLTNIVEWSAPSESAQTNSAVYHAENANRVTLNANIGTDNYVKMGIHRVSGVTTDVALIGTIYYKSVNSDTIYSEAFYIERDATEFGMYLDVYRNGAIAAAIKNEEKEILYIDFRNVDSSAIDGTLNISYIGHSSKDLFTDSDADHVIKMKSDDVTIGMDLDLGGSITYLSKDGINEYEIYRSKFGSLYYNAVRYIGTDPTQSPDYNTNYGTNGYRLVKSGNVNLINIHDTGREIQQSYYAGVSTADGSKTYYNASTGRTETYPNIIGSQDGAYMQYNPVQAGGVENYQSQIIDYSVERNAANAITSVYIKTRAMEWGSRNTYENKLSWSYMETWYSFKNGMIYVTNRFIDWKGFDSINANQNGAIGQETPAIYMASSLGTYYAQTAQYGAIKDSNLGAMTTVEYVSGGTNTAGNYHYAIRDDATMKWHAWLNKEDFGVGIYMPTSGEANVAYFAAKGTGSGNSGDGSNCYDNAYSYSSCCVVSDFAEQTALQYTYVLCVDNLTSMQTKLDGITDVDNSGLTAWTPRG